MTTKTLFTASELESIGIFLEEKAAITPHLIPLHDLETAVYGSADIPLAAGLILPDLDLFWKLANRHEAHEEEALLDADEVLESEDSVDEEPEEAEAPPAPEPSAAPPAGKKGKKAPPPVPPAAEEGKKAPPPVPPAIPRPAEPNWSDSFFDDDYVSTLDVPNHKRTKLEVEFLHSRLNLKPGMKVLDVGCADGRHAVGLALKGVAMQGIDTSVPFLLIANQMAQESGADATFIKKDMREFTPASTPDAVICYGGTFGYFSDADNLELLRRFHSWLAPGGTLLLDVMHRDYVVGQLPSRIWWEGNGCMVMDECYFQYPENRLMVKRNAAFATGKQRNYQLTVRAYTLREITDLVTGVGFQIQSTSGSVFTPGAFTGMLSPSIILVLQK
jgi:SAM-dependent methyltransferase